MIQSLYLGRVAYGEALRLQEELAELRRARRIADTLLLLEHPPVLTLGRNANRANILVSDEMLAQRGVSLYEINRGGDVTYHGPNQLVGYPIFDLRSLSRAGGGRMGPVDFVRLLEEALIGLCAHYGVHAGRIPGLTGIWCGGAEGDSGPENSLDTGRIAAGPESTVPAGKKPVAGPPADRRKIAAIGIHVSRGITSHGFAFNLSTDLTGFSLIHPCGIAACPVTTLRLEIPEPAAMPTLESLAEEAARRLAAVFQQPLVALENVAALRAAAGAVSAAEDQSSSAPAPETPAPEIPAPDFPAEDTPLRIPPELERLRGAPERPVRA